MKPGTRELIHGTCVALGRRAALLRGTSGAGKSDLALRFIALQSDTSGQPALVADDQVFVEACKNGAPLVGAPATIAGRIEVRGIGIVDVPFIEDARLVLVCDLVDRAEVPRMAPETPERTVIAGVSVPLMRLDAFEPSAPLKLKLALLRAAPDDPN
jgi:serine kinase of HPr protein (carbohydrate metabolism regulator)